ncbi:MAG: 50S ribosomal protein L23 [Clostridia bacterium]|nr:50S ribosomal protein L23 [Clostridia bacterium]MBO4517739.1 50S ribosomal protein L23 [Clostridia bacterium]
MAAHDIILKPLLSEKSYAGIKDKKYSFIVAKNANKTQIKLAVEEIFGVKVEKVNTANVHGKLKRQGKYEGYTPDYKKAIVKLTADSKSIAFFDSLS